jgi:putative peptide zinc metalloprotease protein
MLITAAALSADALMVRRAAADRVIPALDPAVRLSRFDERARGGERYLVEAGNSCFAVGRGLHDVLVALAEQKPATLGELSQSITERTGETIPLDTLEEIIDRILPRALFQIEHDASRKTPFIVRGTILRDPIVSKLTAPLTWMYDRRVVAPVLVTFGILLSLTLRRSLATMHTSLAWQEVVLLYAAVIVSGLVHELGHATACSRYGCPNGDIGFALYWIFPAFYTDVTKAWRLSSKRRAVVDIGGMYFQTVVVIVTAIFALTTGSVIAYRFIWITLLTMLTNLNPVFKLDGYWLFSDLTGLTNLHKRMRDGFVAIWRRAIHSLVPGRSDLVAAPAVPGAVLSTYLGIVVLYVIYVSYFLSSSIRMLMLRYPRQLAAAMSALDAAPTWQKHAIALLNIASISIWPLLLTIAVVAMSARLVKLVRTFATRSNEEVLP